MKVLEKNEFRYRSEVDRLVFQIEVYDQVWLARAKNNDFDSCTVDNPKSRTTF